jgi:hypothetical protein
MYTDSAGVYLTAAEIEPELILENDVHFANTKAIFSYKSALGELISLTAYLPGKYIKWNDLSPI